MDPEELMAASAAYRALERADSILSGWQSGWEELEFGLVERTVIVDDR
jgi:hypothetical protein